MVILSFLGYLGEIESDSQTVWICICTIVPRSALPIFKSRFAVLDEIRLQGQFSCSWICMQSVGKVKYFSAFQYARRKNHRHHHWVKNDYNSRSDRTKKVFSIRPGIVIVYLTQYVVPYLTPGIYYRLRFALKYLIPYTIPGLPYTVPALSRTSSH